jgi:2-dehydro-3-deoxyphosphogluconate aldolase/(4S)-4-hydroxy-2-oxoglutarate aldolase
VTVDPILEQIGAIGLVPVVTIDEPAAAPATGEALRRGGLPCIEITLRTDAALAGIAALARTHPDLLVGAGTVMTVDQAEAAVAAGAGFVVTPGFNQPVVEWCVDRAVTVIPGVATPTDIHLAQRYQLTALKFFPAEALGGLRILRALSGPFPEVSFVPTGGIGPDNLAEYIAHPAVLACGGSWIADRASIADRAFESISQRAAAAVAQVKEVRPE